MRLKQIFNDLNKEHMVVIRFNPDYYIDKNNKFINSCFSRCSNDGSWIVKDYNDFDKRLEILFIVIEYWRVNTPSEQIIVQYLFY